MSLEIVYYASFLFFLSELGLIITKRSKKKESKTTNDKKSLILLWIAVPVSLTVGFSLANHQQWDVINQIIAISGLSVFLIGFIIRWLSIFQLNKEFTVDVAINKKHQLRTDGIYKNIRHPSYLGLALICLGLSIGTNSLVSLFIINIPIFLAIHYRIHVEENMLIQEFGETYREYIINTHRMIPKLY